MVTLHVIKTTQAQNVTLTTPFGEFKFLLKFPKLMFHGQYTFETNLVSLTIETPMVRKKTFSLKGIKDWLYREELQVVKLHDGWFEKEGSLLVSTKEESSEAFRIRVSDSIINTQRNPWEGVIGNSAGELQDLKLITFTTTTQPRGVLGQWFKPSLQKCAHYSVFTKEEGVRALAPLCLYEGSHTLGPDITTVNSLWYELAPLLGKEEWLLLTKPSLTTDNTSDIQQHL